MNKYICLKQDTIDRLKKYKVHPRQTWDELINEMIDGDKNE